jgi:hypothetical protein
MDDKLARALAIVQERTGFGVFKKPAASAKHTEGQHTDKATHGVKPRSQKGRKYSAKAEAKRAAWRRSKGFMTRKEKLELPDNLDAPEAAVGPQDGPIEDTEGTLEGVVKPVSASTAGLGFVGNYFDLPPPTLPSQPTAPDQKLTYGEAKARGHVTQQTWGVFQYRPRAGADWITCRVEGEEPPKVIEIRRPAISDLYARSLPVGIDRRCDHAKRGMPRDGTCTGNCDGKFTPNE